jgi:nitroimidazol reductase NimA-like FMN-containing flavoprotein (pyridoxamine 5'-phosphate oxidase superfamily)
MPGSYRRRELSRAEALRLLSSVRLGRVIFTEHALPAVRPVLHVVENGRIVFRTSSAHPINTTTVTGAGTVLAFEADVIDTDSQAGWTVTAVGPARSLRDPAEVRHFRQALRGTGRQEDDQIVAIQADMLTGFQLAGNDADLQPA